jgi:hypothetical protein
VPFLFDSVDFCDDGGFYGDVYSLDGITWLSGCVWKFFDQAFLMNFYWSFCLVYLEVFGGINYTVCI